MPQKKKKKANCASKLSKCMKGTRGKHGAALSSKRGACARAFLNCSCGRK